MSDSTSVLDGLTTCEAAARFRVGEDCIRAWIKSGQLRATNTADARCAKP
jgi:excisionase family DNA binding protein